MSKELTALNAPGSGSSVPGRAADAAARPIVGVAATVPNYLDRREIMVRDGPHEVKATEDARWAEDLSLNAARAITDDLGAMLPSATVIMVPSRLAQAIDYEVHADFSNFDIDADGSVTLMGYWSILDGDRVRASGRILQHGSVPTDSSFDATAAVLSRQLRSVSSEIAAAVVGLPARSRPRG